VRVIDWKTKFAGLCLVMIVCVTIIPGRVLADDGRPSGTLSSVHTESGTADFTGPAAVPSERNAGPSAVPVPGE
jgi:hypothetical protein